MNCYLSAVETKQKIKIHVNNRIENKRSHDNNDIDNVNNCCNYDDDNDRTKDF